VVIQILKELKIAGLQPDIYIISPFLIVAENLRKLLINSGVLNGWVEDSYLWTTERVGTVHTVQGREAEAVIFVLGAPSQEQNGARRWAGSTPNILNVAITRAKEAIYVVGNRSHWKSAGLFSQLVEGIPE
jgi:superfamily I DNA and/or RNA helicase